MCTWKNGQELETFDVGLILSDSLAPLCVTYIICVGICLGPELNACFCSIFLHCLRNAIPSEKIIFTIWEILLVIFDFDSPKSAVLFADGVGNFGIWPFQIGLSDLWKLRGLKRSMGKTNRIPHNASRLLTGNCMTFFQCTFQCTGIQARIYYNINNIDILPD